MSVFDACTATYHAIPCSSDQWARTCGGVEWVEEAWAAPLWAARRASGTGRARTEYSKIARILKRSHVFQFIPLS